ncbi:DUF4328 domain-containing protein [Streptomyces ipomoeae]|uniref:DUF4328 domain-containing protein n=1 Tax=Streptomyces ipomoeae TaxID=103232 RepID=A0AAE9AVL0_9ACTN|nr:DUF4328 domain-containing protein [Streptomyces ipomoeae]MDX2696801.1 DUF4328 domain-containing protein [Streptomyces ipomoeae]MDX2826037.1 DUF4328 domain-containing protein [Streptomyces ipomoeae]MDX2844355.1 DUF4328 domain-containing protein [Streptomyces ipomoeae]MDX2878973.1 DUF4328 domain-containing protein [Streptomyces ipomoeae]TQE16615.1 DUF4328 domain-containing protein [Streptomyces ipomoeae]
MTCTRCRRFEAAPGGELCRACEAEEAHPDVNRGPGGLPRAPQAVAGAPAAPTAWLQSPVGLGRAVAILLGVVAVTDLVAVWADVAMLDVLGRMVDGEYGAAVERDADRADRFYAMTGVVQAVAFLATVIVFLIWFHRVRVNAEVFEPFGHRKKRGWAIGGWLVPIVNLWFPRRIALDSWDASSPWGRPRSHALINAWWTLWLIGGAASQGSSSAYRRAETVEEIQSAVKQVLFADAFEIPTAVLAILFVLKLTRMQDDKARSGPRAPEPVAL